MARARVKRTLPDRIYVPLPLLAVIIVLALAVVGAIAAWVIHKQHEPHLVTVSQTEINNNSTLARTLGSPLSKVEDDKTMHLLVYYDGYQDDAVAQHFVGLIQATLRETEPFKSANNLTVTTLTSSVSQCHPEKSVKTTLHCDDSLLTQVNNLHYKHFKLLVLSPENFAPNATVARGKNSAFYLPTYQGALTSTEVDTFVSLYFLHEFGHSFGLRDEYSRTRNGAANQEANEDTGSKAYAAAQPNCAPDKATAEKWWGAYAQGAVSGVGYNTGCAGVDKYYYPVKNTVMGSDPTDATYGRVSEDYLRGVLQCFYENSDKITYPDNEPVVSGSPTDCKAFRAEYSNFWKS